MLLRFTSRTYYINLDNSFTQSTPYFKYSLELRPHLTSKHFNLKNKTLRYKLVLYG